jgi:hypothetical protein
MITIPFANPKSDSLSWQFDAFRGSSLMIREECKFVATEGHNGLFWIRADQNFGEGGLAISALLGFELAANTSRQEAHQAADYMNQHIKGFYYSR